MRDPWRLPPHPHSRAPASAARPCSPRIFVEAHRLVAHLGQRDRFIGREGEQEGHLGADEGHSIQNGLQVGIGEYGGDAIIIGHSIFSFLYLIVFYLGVAEHSSVTRRQQTPSDTRRQAVFCEKLSATAPKRKNPGQDRQEVARGYEH